jgi:hypothetical protein
MTAPALTPVEAAAEAWAMRPYRSLTFGEQQVALDIVRPIVDRAFEAYVLLGGAPRSAPLVALSKWIDEGNANRDPEAITWGRVAKVSEEAGEAIAAYIGATGQNPRKGVTHTIDDVTEELLDVAVTALGAIEHLRGHDGASLSLLDGKIARVAARAGVLQ